MLQIKRTVFCALVVVLVLSLVLIAYGQDIASVNLAEPVAITTCGQSPGALMAKLIFTRAKIKNHHDDLLTADDLKERSAQGEAFKTLVITTGTSMKGMGAAGTDINVELSRIEALIKEAKNQGILVIGAHIEGAARRVDHTDKLSVEAVCPQADLLMVTDSSDEDGYFTSLADQMNVPLLKAKEALNLVEALQDLINR